MNGFSVDLEDWFQGIEIPPEKWSGFEGRIEKNSKKLLQILKKNRVFATFFVSGYIAEKNPKLIKKIQTAGHEIGSHGYNHEFVYNLTPKKFEKDLQKSLKILQKITGCKILGYRAPYFSITKKSLWAIDILKKNGLKYDSSIFPIKNYRYGIPDAPKNPYQIKKDFWELPPTLGGAYFRLLPYFLFRYKFKRGGVFYLHPWEIDDGQPRLKLPKRIAFPHYFNLKKTEKRLEKLTRDFSFSSLEKTLTELKKT